MSSRIYISEVIGSLYSLLALTFSDIDAFINIVVSIVILFFVLKKNIPDSLKEKLIDFLKIIRSKKSE